MKTQRKIITRLPAELSEELKTVPQDIWDITEEIRLRNGQPVCLRYGMRERHLNLRTNSQLLQQTLNQLIQFSYYAYEDDLARGFVTVEGGHRVGICGKMVIKHGQPAVMREISSMNIRFARSIIGCCRKILPEMMHCVECVFRGISRKKLMHSEMEKSLSNYLRTTVIIKKVQAMVIFPRKQRETIPLPI